MKTKNVCIIVNKERERSKEVVSDLVDWLTKQRIQVCLNPRSISEKTELVISLGGDGTLLSSARQVANKRIPLFSVNLGNLGFLTDTTLEEMYSSLEMILKKRYKIDERMVIESVVSRKNKQIFKAFCLNDSVVTKGSFSRIIYIKLTINNEYVSTIASDGIIFSTPTGSTGYCLAAGGPILNPSMKAIVIIPICPHALSIRPIVVSSNEIVSIEFQADHKDIMLTLDGQVGFDLVPGDTVTVKKADYTVKLIKSERRKFYETLSTKLKWGGIRHSPEI